MYIDEALQNVLHDLDDILIPGKDAGKMQDVKVRIHEVIRAVQQQRQAQQEQAKKEAQAHED